MNLEKENKILRKIVEDTLWMAARYSENKEACCAGKTIKEAIEAAESLKIVSKSENDVCFDRKKEISR